MSPEAARQYCRQKVAASHSSFTVSFRFLEAQRRDAITAFYAFCREVDDVVDETPDPHTARRQLDDWRSEIDALYAGRPSHPVTLALAASLPHFNLPQQYFQEIIDGMQMDLEQNRYASFKELHLYCYRVASVVGLVAAEIFGYQDRRTLKYAHDLGLAFQLTNILRDVGEDARRGRIYLPTAELEQFQVTQDDLLAAHYTDNFRRLMQFQAERAEQTYQRALAQLPACDRNRQRPGLIMARIYHQLLKKIRRHDYQVLDRRIALTSFGKLWLVGLSLLERPMP
ncbi:MAG: presqualene diphosphate synthase HpnD [Sterolibacterium sp.]|jgi:phytoene synthase|nr:presqualene diphosphate synthase HpnD [Sterolibacterium sp.]MBP9799795.1 presqualene diphosphate synthase HpnD [Sterolibacterium sp.]